MAAPYEQLAEEFRRFSDVECRHIAPFYSLLTRRIADDPRVLQVASQTRPGQPPPNMLLGAVRFLLDRGSGPELLALYPTSAGQSIDGDSYPLFRNFVLANSESIIGLLKARRVQSNVVRRAAVLLLGLMQVSKLLDGQPLAHVEIGASLGLTVLWRHFSYDYGNGRKFGVADSPVAITSVLSGRSPFDGSPAFPNTASEAGIEIAPASLDDADAIAWFEALIWPEHDDNRRLWRAAVPMAAQYLPRVLAGDANKVLPHVIRQTPQGIPICVYHSHTLNQFSEEAKSILESTLCAASREGQVFRLSFEGERTHSTLRLFEYAGGARTAEHHLADCEAHGRWINWR